MVRAGGGSRSSHQRLFEVRTRPSPPLLPSPEAFCSPRPSVQRSFSSVSLSLSLTLRSNLRSAHEMVRLKATAQFPSPADSRRSGPGGRSLSSVLCHMFVALLRTNSSINDQTNPYSPKRRIGAAGVTELRFTPDTDWTLT